MRTVETAVYKFEELSDEAKETAITNIRNSYYEDNNFAEWAIDDCALLEPKHKELDALFNTEYNFPLLKNNREVYFSLDRSRYIDISNAMEVQDDEQFLFWLGINKEDFLDEDGYFMVDYKIGEDTIEFESNDWNYEFSLEQDDILIRARKKFEDHCQEILKRIESDINYRYTDEAIIEEIESRDLEFTEDGKMW